MDDEQRKILIIYTVGTAHAVYPMEDTDEVIERVNSRLIEFNEQPITKDEKEILETIDDILYLYQMNSSNRREFRDIVTKKRRNYAKQQ